MRHELLRNDSLSKWASFPKAYMESRQLQGFSSYSLYTVDPLRNLHRGIYEVMKQLMVTYFSSDRHRTGGDTAEESRLLNYKHEYSKCTINCSELLKVERSSYELVYNFRKEGDQMNETEYLQRLGYV